MNRRTLVSRYALFAALSTAVNVGVQWLVLRAPNGPASLYLAIAGGTAAGLVVKYLLDCRFIFAYVNKPRLESLATFTLYVLMSGVTTAVFWGAELIGDAVVPGELGRYAGAVIGLAVGYTLKYHLDRNFVFTRRTS